MSAGPPLARRAATGPSMPHQVGLLSRLTGLGSVFGKTIRDSRRGLIIQVVLLAGLPLLVLVGIAGKYTTPASRQELVALATGIGPAAQGLSGPPVNVGTMGGWVQWKYGTPLALIAAFWSVLALTRTLAAEAGAGSLDVLAATPASRRRIALEKVGAHLSLLAVVSAVATTALAVGGSAFARLPGDRIPIRAAAGFGVWVGLMAMAFGALGFAVAQLLGRSAGAWTAGTVLVLGPLLNNYRRLVPAVGGIADLTPWGWTCDHLPLAGRFDWASLVAVAVLGVFLLALGVEIFVRTDLDAATRLRLPHLSVPATGLRGPLSRSAAEQLPLALAWGTGLGVFGLAMAALSRSLADAMTTSPDLAHALTQIFPGYDLASAGGFLQLMVQLMFVGAGFAAVTLVSRWSADETSHRLEILLAAPVSRAGWALRNGFGVLAALLVMTLVISAGTGLGALLAGSSPGAPMLGAFSLGLYAAAVTGFGLAVGGVVGAPAAAPALATVVTLTYLVDLLVPALGLPDGLRQVALTAHFGRPMTGSWDGTGVLVCLVLAVGGAGLGALGLSRRDLHQ